MKKNFRGRRQRRQMKMKIRSHGKFKINHASKSGRTGSVFSKHLHSRKGD